MKDSQSPWFLFVQRFRKHTMALVGMVILVSITILVAFAPFFTTHDPMQQNLLNRFQPPSATHWLGTDDLGRDLWARILYGGRISLSVGLLAMAVSITLGSLIGLLAGYFGGWVDSVLMRTTEIFLSIPRLFVLIALGMFIRSIDL